MRTRLSPRCNSNSATPLSFTILSSSFISSMVISERDQFFRRRSEDLASVRGNNNRVLDADTPKAFNVCAGFDGNRHPGLEASFVSAAEARGLVNLQPESVACGMGERFV